MSSFLNRTKRYQRIRLRRMMRGYRSIRESDQPDRIEVLKQALTKLRLTSVAQNFSSIVMGRGAESGEIILRQYLLLRLGGINLNRALLMSLGKKGGSVVFPLPKEWRILIHEHGFKIAHFRSAVLWKFYVFTLLVYGVFTVFKVLFFSEVYPKSYINKAKSHAFFMNLTLNNLPRKSDGSYSHDIITWYLNRSDKVFDVEEIHHSVTTAKPITVDGVLILPRTSPLPHLQGVHGIVSYIHWGIHASAIAAIDFLQGKWWHALLLNQCALAAQARNLPAGMLAKEYLFHNSGWIYRPLWTYEAQSMGSMITFYFYSANCEGFQNPNVLSPVTYGYQSMNWPHYLVWDQYQADFIRRMVGASPKISIVGSIWFGSNEELMPEDSRKKIAVFDVTPVRPSFYQSLAIGFDYYVPSTSINFFMDIHHAVEEKGLILYWKEKRNKGKNRHPKYRFFIEHFIDSDFVIDIDSNISANRMIEACDVVVSMPFTSTALIACELGKPSCYYDSTGKLEKNDRAAHGVLVIQGAIQLKEWLDEQINLL